ncbi:MAG: CRISPR-associated protein Cas5 [Anaerolineae bacterium]|nr:CRISPR-associated protein Cas5 [Anaerolineae bacterium]NUQ04755.1 CRISPR-associated protein Cas5 [Anaerolineae bacterium]
MIPQEMPALKVVIAGYAASFRYPHFVQGIHPTYEMPPPATLYGLIVGVLGDYFPRDGLRFAYHFSYRAKFNDYEHLHFPPSEIKKPEERALLKQIDRAFGVADMPPAINPFVRELLFEPRLTLYLDRTELDGVDLVGAFRQPRYPVVLGRSQDLMTLGPPEVVALRQAERCYVTGTLLSLEDAAVIGGQFYAVTMPRYISPARQPEWAQYAVLPESRRPPIFPDDALLSAGGALNWWVDPAEPHPWDPTLPRAVYWHSWSA